MSDNTIYDVAQMAGVSASTVSRVINQRSGVNEETSRKVNDALNKLKFRPRWKAAPPKSIGVVVHPHRNCLSNHFSATLISAISEALFAEGYVVQLIPRLQSNSSLASLNSLAITNTIQGLIIIPMHQFYGLSERLEEEQINIPHVAIGPEKPEEVAFDFNRVGSDDMAAGRQLATFLLRQNYRRFSIVAPDRRDQSHDRRIRGILETLAEENIDPGCVPIHEYADVTTANGEAAAIEIATCAKLPEAVILTDSTLALGFCYGCARMGISIPSQLAVAGFEDDEELATAAPSMTAMRQPTRKMGELAVQILLGRIHGRNLDNLPGLLKHSLAIRNSTSCVAQ